MKVTRNFDIEKMVKSNALSLWLNQYGNAIVKSMEDGLDNSTDITGQPFATVSKFTRESKQDKHAHKKPLIRSGRLRKSIRKLPATMNKLSFIIKSAVKSKARWNLEVDGKKYKGSRKTKHINYGALLNRQGGYKTNKKSFVPNKVVKQRYWFGIKSSFLVGGSDWNKMKSLHYYWEKAYRTNMKEHK